MDNTFQNDADALKLAMRRMAAQMRYAIPGEVTEFDAAKQIATVVPAIRKIVTKEGTQEFLDMPPIIKVPMIYPHAQTLGFALTLPVAPGDQVLLIVADRSIDLWAEFGGLQNPSEPIESRHNDITDSLAVIGATPSPLAMANYLTSGIEMRNKDRSVRVTVKDTDITVAAGDSSIIITKDGNLNLNAGTTNLKINQSGVIESNVDIIIGGKSFLAHIHTGDSGGSTSPPL